MAESAVRNHAIEKGFGQIDFQLNRITVAIYRDIFRTSANWRTQTLHMETCSLRSVWRISPGLTATRAGSMEVIYRVNIAQPPQRTIIVNSRNVFNSTLRNVFVSV